MAKDKIRVGMVGLGVISWAHEGGFSEAADECVITAMCDIDAAKASDRASIHGAKAYTDYRELINDPHVDLVDIILPHHLHYQAALDTIECAKHLLIEKPLAITYAESLDICQRARSKGVHFGVAENTRYVKAYIEAERVIKSGRLGDINLVRTFLPANEHARLSLDYFWGKKASFGGGTIIDSGPHSFYLLKWLFGDFKELQAFSSQLYQLDSEVEDNADVRGRLANGADFLCSFSFTAEVPHSERLEVYGTNGSLIVDQLNNPPVRLYSGADDFDGTPVDSVPYDSSGWHYFSIVDEIKDFILGVAEDRTPTVDPLDAAYSIKIVEKAYESIRLKSVVQV